MALEPAERPIFGNGLRGREGVGVPFEIYEQICYVETNSQRNLSILQSMPQFGISASVAIFASKVPNFKLNRVFIQKENAPDLVLRMQCTPSYLRCPVHAASVLNSQLFRISNIICNVSLQRLLDQTLSPA
jgi:hypothetical protein